MTIDSSCIWWERVCGNKLGCGYYDNNLLRNRCVEDVAPGIVSGVSDVITLVMWTG